MMQKNRHRRGKLIHRLEENCEENVITTHRNERISTVKFLLFATLKLSRDIPATVQQDHPTLLTVTPLPSINRANSISRAIRFYVDGSDWFLSNKHEGTGDVLPPWCCVWWPRWGRPETGPGTRSAPPMMAQFLGNKTGGRGRVDRNHCTLQCPTDETLLLFLKEYKPVNDNVS